MVLSHAATDGDALTARYRLDRFLSAAKEPVHPHGYVPKSPDCAIAGSVSDSQEGTVTGTNKKMVAAVEAYFTDLRCVRASGGATGERSYPALTGLLGTVGATLKPKVFCVLELADQGAGHPDGALYTAKQVQRGRRSRPLRTDMHSHSSVLAPSSRLPTARRNARVRRA